MKRPTKSKLSKLVGSRSSREIPGKSQLFEGSQFKATASIIAPTEKLNRSQASQSTVNKSLLAKYLRELKRLQSDICRVTNPDQTRQLIPLFDQISAMMTDQRL